MTSKLIENKKARCGNSDVLPAIRLPTDRLHAE